MASEQHILEIGISELSRFAMEPDPDPEQLTEMMQSKWRMEQLVSDMDSTSARRKMLLLQLEDVTDLDNQLDSDDELDTSELPGYQQPLSSDSVHALLKGLSDNRTSLKDVFDDLYEST